jgi:hypothetical protein
LGCVDITLSWIRSHWTSRWTEEVFLWNTVLTESLYMPPKQREMDGIIERIYNSLATIKGDRTLMVICGDHGMNDV